MYITFVTRPTYDTILLTQFLCTPVATIAKSQPTPEWTAIFYRMGSWSPWNMGNWNGNADDPHAAVDYWAADKANFESHGTRYALMVVRVHWFVLTSVSAGCNVNFQ